MPRALRRWLMPAPAALALLSTAPRGAAAQAGDPILAPRAVTLLLREPDTTVIGPTPLRTAPLWGAPDDRRVPWWTPLASAVVPGAGQARLGQDRFVAYAAMEGYLWIRYLTDARAGGAARRRYRDLALRVSRSQFPGPKPVGDFEYYERMEDWVASGAFDLDPGTDGVQPESDTTTYNGALWLLARRTYWAAPNAPPPPGSAPESAAMAFYLRSAVRPEFAWSWRGAPLQHDEYRGRIRASNEAFRRAAHDIGAVLANHLLSTVDAYVSMRLRVSAGEEEGSVELRGTIDFR